MERPESQPMHTNCPDTDRPDMDLAELARRIVRRDAEKRAAAKARVPYVSPPLMNARSWQHRFQIWTASELARERCRIATALGPAGYRLEQNHERPAPLGETNISSDRILYGTEIVLRRDRDNQRYRLAIALYGDGVVRWTDKPEGKPDTELFVIKNRPMLPEQWPVSILERFVFDSLREWAR